jgi:hypothetical protein
VNETKAENFTYNLFTKFLEQAKASLSCVCHINLFSIKIVYFPISIPANKGLFPDLYLIKWCAAALA